MAMNKLLIEKQRKGAEEARKGEMLSEDSLVTSNLNEEILEEISLEGFEQIDAHHKNMSSAVKGFGSITIINHEKCGRRVHLANIIWRDLGCPEYVKLYIKDGKLIIMPSKGTGVAVKFDRTTDFAKAVESYSGKIVLYATDTVKRLTAEWDLHFDANCCYTGGVHRKCIVNGVTAVMVTNNSSMVDETLAEETASEENTEETVAEETTTEE